MNKTTSKKYKNKILEDTIILFEKISYKIKIFKDDVKEIEK